MSHPKPGQRVRVEFDGTVTRIEDGWLVVEQDEYPCFEHQLWLPVSGDQQPVYTQLDPAFWPPQIGDIWEAGGFEYMIRDARSASVTTRRTVGYDKGYPLVSPLDHAAPTMRGRFDDLLAASPKLIRRRGGFSK
jgi:hypothetical protein